MKARRNYPAAPAPWVLAFALIASGFAVDPCAAQNPVREMRQKARPGNFHRKLAPLEGTWRARIQYRVRPDLAPETASGKAEFRWILGGRFLEQTVNGKGIAGGFEGRGLIGHDNVLGHYVGSWADTMNSGLARSTGKLEPDGRTIRFTVAGTDPLAGEERTLQGYLRILGPDELQYVLFAPHPDTGEAVAVLHIDYRRKK